eukprot:Gb_37848 [translate_table: standard]
MDVLKESKKLHVLVFPFLAHGHISPFLELSKRLVMDDGLRISFVSTPRNISKIKPLAVLGQGHIDLLELPLPTVEGLPPGAESTADVPNEMLPLLLKAVDRWSEAFEMLLQQLRPHCIVYDFAQWWTPNLAVKLGIPAVIFITFSAAATSYSLTPSRARVENMKAEDLTIPPPDYPDSPIRWRLSEARENVGTYMRNKDDIRFIDRCVTCFDGSCAIAINSCSELEGKYLDYLQKDTGKPVFPVGPILINSPKQTTAVETETPDWLQWLDDRAPSSVVYVPMGSECFPSREQIHALALGLEASHVPFLWALRSHPNCCNDEKPANNHDSTALPEGFQSRTRDRGFVIGGWAPQLEILSHSSTGAFLTHCGWNSLMEGMNLGLPLIALPMKYDQSLSARLVAEELKVAVEIQKESDGSFHQEEVCRAVKMVMAEEKGREVRLKAMKLGRSVRNKESHDKNIIDFIHYLKQNAASNCTENI